MERQGAAAALLDVKADLHEVPRPAKLVPPPAPEPEPTYVSEWLSNAGLKKLCDGFEEQGLTEESPRSEGRHSSIRYVIFFSEITSSLYCTQVQYTAAAPYVYRRSTWLDLQCEEETAQNTAPEERATERQLAQ